MGDKRQQLLHAEKYLLERSIQILNRSSQYITEAWGVTDQPDFINQVFEADFQNSPDNLLQEILDIEVDLGRSRREKWTSRTIDIDILYFRNLVRSSGHLKLPHPHLADRRFTLEPLVEIAPDFVHPILNKTNFQLLQSCKDPLRVNRLQDE